MLDLLPSNFKDISEAFLVSSAEFLFGKKKEALINLIHFLRKAAYIAVAKPTQNTQDLLKNS